MLATRWSLTIIDSEIAWDIAGARGKEAVDMTNYEAGL